MSSTTVGLCSGIASLPAVIERHIPSLQSFRAVHMVFCYHFKHQKFSRASRKFPISYTIFDYFTLFSVRFYHLPSIAKFADHVHVFFERF